jgi:hypothetical protein
MKESHIILSLIIVILFYLTINDIYLRFDQHLIEKNTTYKNDTIYENDSSYNDETNLLVPTKNMIYNPNDIYRPANDLPIQEQSTDNVSEIDKSSIMVNTSGDTPLVYSLDELTHTISNIPPTSAPSGYIPIEIDTGSGNITRNTTVNNNNLNSFHSIN